MFRRDFLKRVYKVTAAFVSASWQFMTMDAYGAFLQVSNALAQAIGLLRKEVLAFHAKFVAHFKFGKWAA